MPLCVLSQIGTFSSLFFCNFFLGKKLSRMELLGAGRCLIPQKNTKIGETIRKLSDIK